MRYGICILPEYPWAEARPRWQRAEELGFDHAWTYDHLVWAGLPDAPWHSTVVTLTAAATATERIRLGTFVASPNYRHPVTFTRDVVSLDEVSGGRLLLGLGAGGDRDAAMLGEQLTRKQRTDRFAEFVGLLDRTLSQDHVDHAGEFYQAVDARNAPGCTQQPRVPFVVAANGPRAMGLAARHGQGWLTTGQGRGLATGPRGDSGQVEQWWRGVAELAERFAEIGAATADRTQGAAVDRYLSLDACGVPALSGAGFFDDQVGRAQELGFTDVVVHWPRDTDPYQATIGTLEEVAARHLTGSAVP